VYFVEVFPALLAEILVWGALGTKNADTSTVLPDLADITLNEEASNIFCEIHITEELGVRTLEGGLSRVLVGTTDAPHSLVLLLQIVTNVVHIDCFGPGGFVFIVLTTLAPPT
jgi:hypothetical protein